MENKQAEIERLTEIFRNAGARDPEMWAISQVEEGIPQLALFSFAKALWEGVVREEDSTWISPWIEFELTFCSILLFMLTSLLAL